ncbi:MAG: hypothetical protein K6U74_00300 [Firmicutes bacterium]|nr:hypothetical protein [Bacillota bacterium]
MQCHKELKRFQKLQESVSRTLGLAALVARPDGRPLTKVTNLYSFWEIWLHFELTPSALSRGIEKLNALP